MASNTPETYNSTPQALSPLETMSSQYLSQEIAINRYSFNNGYGISNPDAVSPLGLGENQSGQIGTTTDINTRNQLEGTNRYGDNNPYGLSNPDAISPLGLGENQTGQIGTNIDIQTRNKLESINDFNENKTYPDF